MSPFARVLVVAALLKTPFIPVVAIPLAVTVLERKILNKVLTSEQPMTEEERKHVYECHRSTLATLVGSNPIDGLLQPDFDPMVALSTNLLKGSSSRLKNSTSVVTNKITTMFRHIKK